MEYWVGLDVSLKKTSICVVDQSALVTREGVVDSDPESISVYVRSEAPARYDGGGEFVRFFASARKADRDCNIEPPASPYAIMRRAYPYRGENSGPGNHIVGKLDTQTRN
jgi:hypothetical protein